MLYLVQQKRKKQKNWLSKRFDDISEKTGIRERSCRRYEWFIFRYLRMSELFYNWNLHAQNISGLSLFFKKL